jgi:hypothetical protein
MPCAERVGPESCGQGRGIADVYPWLERAYGRRAETSNFLAAAVLAPKARQSFETAVRLDPCNLEAIGDFFAYYLEAPAFLGVGLAKAVALSRRVHHFWMARSSEAGGS